MGGLKITVSVEVRVENPSVFLVIKQRCINFTPE